ncbi:proteasome ATPase [Actinomyces sp. B33]|uniref:proteasome ATPase n=1 Tax=Actinomyces sp. B33 TaxID=2942131 RepID=UPI0023416D29|nr:proteasome ATPase [Actinomyces sp. B33]MDC4233355.1 proteasome ATPase [Actinomyces sp. B33]
MSSDARADRIDELQRLVVSLEEKNGRLSGALTQVRGELVRLQAQLHEVNRPPQTLAMFLGADQSSRQIDAVVNGRRMRLAVAPALDLAALSYGQWVRVDDKMIAVAPDSFTRTGSMASVLELVGPDRVLVAGDAGQEHLLHLAGPLRHGNLRPGDSLMVDLRSGIAFERIVRSDVEQLLTPETPETTYADIGGLDAQIQQVRDAIELPLRHPDLYRAYGLRPPKGILLYGPPGSGKTLIAKAVANSLTRQGSQARTYFLSIKGPELLNKFVGETERQIRAIFSRARSLAAGDVPVVIFFDEMEALFRTRGTGVSSDVETMIVPQLLAEMDGVEALDNVVIIGASNRADMIDPAVLRPGRLDVRIRVERPDRDGAVDIFSKYLTGDLPIRADEAAAAGGADRATAAMITAAVDRLYAVDESTTLFEATLASGTVRPIHLADIVSGALIAGIVERAKKHAIKEALEGGAPGLSLEHLMRGVDEETRESIELAATSSPDDWARTIGLREDVVAIRPVEGVGR